MSSTSSSRRSTSRSRARIRQRARGGPAAEHARVRRLFVGTRHRIEGWEHLPEWPGHIFIMNHLGYHPDNVLPNNFVLTLDTHFVSAMVVFERGEAPIRVVRKSRPDEYGHQQFYDRLGYVYTYSGHVDAGDEDPCSSPEARRRLFLDVAGAHLQAEGTSSSAWRGPGRPPSSPRCGSDQVPSGWPPTSDLELPLLVPVAVANFDKKLTTTTTAAVVHEPFRPRTTWPTQVTNAPCWTSSTTGPAPGSASGCARRPRWPAGAADQLPKPSGTPLHAASQPAPLERRPVVVLGAVRVAYRGRAALGGPPRRSAMARTVGAGIDRSTSPTPSRSGRRPGRRS